MHIRVGSNIELAATKGNKRLASALSQMLGFPDRRGLNGRHTKFDAGDIPETFEQIFENLDFVGQSILKANPTAKKSLIRKFSVCPILDPKKTIAEVKNISVIEGVPFQIRNLVETGEVLFFVILSIPPPLRSKGMLDLEFGLSFALEVANPNMSLYVYSDFHVNTHKDPVGYEWQLCKSLDEAPKSIRSVLAKSKKLAKKELSGWQKSAVDRLRLPHTA